MSKIKWIILGTWTALLSASCGPSITSGNTKIRLPVDLGSTYSYSEEASGGVTSMLGNVDADRTLTQTQATPGYLKITTPDGVEVVMSGNVNTSTHVSEVVWGVRGVSRVFASAYAAVDGLFNSINTAVKANNPPPVTPIE